LREPVACATEHPMNANKATVNANGSYLMYNSEGQIVKTGDVLRRFKQYQYENGELMVKKFGIWNKVNGRLTESGTLITNTIDGQTQESLDGTVISLSLSTKSLIAQNDFTGEEIALNSQGVVRHRFKKDGIDHFHLYEHGVLITDSETYDEAKKLRLKTRAEELDLECVIRIDRKYDNGKLASESYAFYEERSASPAVRLSFKLPTGEELHLSKVQKVVNMFVNDELSETSFELSEPVSVSRDKEGNVSLIRGISKVRRFQIHGNVCAVVFVDKSGDENIFFPVI
jgi:hypothetical protein